MTRALPLDLTLPNGPVRLAGERTMTTGTLSKLSATIEMVTGVLLIASRDWFPAFS